ncbi:MAG: Nif3-like dinuclear metal center hexameric protein [Candidatus Omnitrophica bacterium]|nr:Nif3-like dinuclear metal center hexameric protein [Candidatus Omnitrophota bacterium]MCM8817473.1 Nif3-like dinuclear metal center hexameric protein [Candidatus Omnitrophota bacterium]
MKVREVVDYILEIAPFRDSYGEIPRDDAIVFGDENTEVKGIGVTWSPTIKVLSEAAKLDLNFVITHEFLFWGHSETIWFKSDKDVMKKKPNALRHKILQEKQMTVYNTHKNWDAASGWGMCDAFPKLLGFEKEINRGRFIRVHEIEPMKIKYLAGIIKEKMKIPVVRVAGDTERKVSKIATAVGGLGQIYGIAEEPYNLGAEVVVFGEAVDYAIRCCVENNMVAIETSHVLSENPGVKNLAKKIKEKFPQTKVEFLDAGYPYNFLG